MTFLNGSKEKNPSTMLEAILEGMARCEYFQDGGCFHCKEKQELINIACGWAFDLGMRDERI